MSTISAFGAPGNDFPLVLMSAKVVSITMLLLLPVLTQAQQAVPCPGPLSEAQLTALLKGSVPAPRIRQLVASCGIDFRPTVKAISRLRSAGMPQTILDAVRATTGSPATVVTGRTKVNPRDGLTYVWIPPGTFQMGCSPGDRECYDHEKPTHQVTITKGFWLGQTPVTQQAYQRVTGQNPSGFKGANLPVEFVSWYEARAYCQAIGGRLPTEAEWEYAARAGSTGARYGNLDEIAWHDGNSGGQTHEVGRKSPNAFGLFDMLGNVWQWTADGFGVYPWRAQSDPSAGGNDQEKVERGGSWSDYPSNVRVSYRGAGPLIYRSSTIGLRCVGE